MKTKMCVYVHVWVCVCVCVYCPLNELCDSTQFSVMVYVYSCQNKLSFIKIVTHYGNYYYQKQVHIMELSIVIYTSDCVDVSDLF